MKFIRYLLGRKIFTWSDVIIVLIGLAINVCNGWGLSCWQGWLVCVIAGIVAGVCSKIFEEN